MRFLTLTLILLFSLGFQQAEAQCLFDVPPAVKTLNYAGRNVTFSNVIINGNKTTFLEVQRGQRVTIQTRIESSKERDYCPGCIVQIYWGINGYISTCAKSFGGYYFRKKKSSLTFNAPLEDGIYFITMGGSLEYSCKNNNDRPNCSKDQAFAVIQVGKPRNERKITLRKMKRGDNFYLRTSFVKNDCFGKLNKTEWFFGDKKLDFDNKKEIPAKEQGVYTVKWSNCNDSFSKSIVHDGSLAIKIQDDEEKDDIKEDEKKDEKTEDDIAEIIKKQDKFVLKHLIFDLGKSTLRQEAKQELDKLADVMQKNKNMKIRLDGHTDTRGNAKKNLKLSQARVRSSKEYLVSKGIHKDRIQTMGWGEQKPLVITKDVEKGKINRRVEVIILKR